MFNNDYYTKHILAKIHTCTYSLEQVWTCLKTFWMVVASPLKSLPVRVRSSGLEMASLQNWTQRDCDWIFLSYLETKIFLRIILVSWTKYFCQQFIPYLHMCCVIAICPILRNLIPVCDTPVDKFLKAWCNNSNNHFSRNLDSATQAYLSIHVTYPEMQDGFQQWKQ